MPLLKREPDIHPVDFFELDSATAPFRVAHVRSRQEKTLARYLLDRGIPFYLPLTDNEVRTKSGSGVRVRYSHTPLFPGYVFIRPPEDEVIEVKRSGVVANLLEVPDESTLARELAQIRDLQQRGMTLVPFPELATGDPVRIREGAFRGYVGMITKEKGRERLIVQVTMIRQSVAVDLGREAVAPA